MSGHRTDGNRGSLARADAKVQLGDMTGGPSALSVVGFFQGRSSNKNLHFLSSFGAAAQLYRDRSFRRAEREFPGDPARDRMESFTHSEVA
jgi:hypothetical protein